MTKPLRIGIAGLGTVGASLARLLQTKAGSILHRAGRPIEVVAVSARDRAKDRGFDAGAMEWHDDPVTLAAQADIDGFVELIGGADGPALECVTAALKRGIPVVTANKALLAHHGVDLARLAAANGTEVLYEAAVAGGIPIIKTMRESLSGNDVTRVYGILNGTCNYMLTRMEREGLSFDVCLKDAQDLGYAEADPTFDIGGFDAAHKLAILTSLAFGTEIDSGSIYIEGIERVTSEDIAAAKDLGYTIKLLAVAQLTDTGIEQRVHPALIPAAAAMAQVSGVTNAVAVDTDLLGSIMLAGPGAGGDATASAVLSDIMDLATGVVLPTLGIPVDKLKPYTRARMRAHEGGYYIRLSVHDRVGAIAAIATRMAQNEISLESIVQRRSSGHGDKAIATVILVTHETTESAVRAALLSISEDGHLAGEAQMLRIEQLD
ncbi:homoserine dehydrogenase [Fulvimarina sp. 2208YS6-2-32]|uniref:Homoserine dehydrogenase n=1 Tax=Fulvimarina uroteuthidis TaxID=3098149 RepID=A0ABU5I3Y5_9HYPH|nr:homoserine dehydrogenase [Fulvimarina sp. 2208YS6-2-32]MDY8110062.1 homoserine dehydrogenase [Fulvimarina sp. 2208YS6-2-32]